MIHFLEGGEPQMSLGTIYVEGLGPDSFNYSDFCQIMWAPSVMVNFFAFYSILMYVVVGKVPVFTM